jgi:hypothetical protein
MSLSPVTMRSVQVALRTFCLSMGDTCFDTESSFKLILIAGDTELAVEYEPLIGVLCVTVLGHDVSVAVHASSPRKLTSMVLAELPRCRARPDRVLVLEENSKQRALVPRNQFELALDDRVEAIRLAERIEANVRQTRFQ